MRCCIDIHGACHSWRRSPFIPMPSGRSPIGRRKDILPSEADRWRILADLRFAFLEGAPYTEEDNRMARGVVVISEAMRKRFFGGESAVGKMIEADGQRFRIVGVVKNVPALHSIPYAEMWAPISTSKSNSYLANLKTVLTASTWPEAAMISPPSRLSSILVFVMLNYLIPKKEPVSAHPHRG